MHPVSALEALPSFSVSDKNFSSSPLFTLNFATIEIILLFLHFFQTNLVYFNDSISFFMKHIGLLSDTHGFLHERLFTFFEKVDEIWHAGDFGSIDLADELAAFKPLKGVYGNIDGQEIRVVYPQHQRFMCEDTDV